MPRCAQPPHRRETAVDILQLGTSAYGGRNFLDRVRCICTRHAYDFAMAYSSFVYASISRMSGTCQVVWVKIRMSAQRAERIGLMGVLIIPSADFCGSPQATWCGPRVTRALSSVSTYLPRKFYHREGVHTKSTNRDCSERVTSRWEK